jgi:hypothetical protein
MLNEDWLKSSASGVAIHPSVEELVTRDLVAAKISKEERPAPTLKMEVGRKTWAVRKAERELFFENKS